MKEDGRCFAQLPDTEATAAFGRRLARLLPQETAGWLILLRGELGAGKSTLARALLEGLGFEGPVPSPTYTLVEPYEIGDRLVYHVDLYRVSDEGELPYLGWDELDQGLVLVEWPERAPALAQRADLDIALTFAGSGRDLELKARTPRVAAVAGGLASGRGE